MGSGGPSFRQGSFSLQSGQARCGKSDRPCLSVCGCLCVSGYFCEGRQGKAMEAAGITGDVGVCVCVSTCLLSKRATRVSKEIGCRLRRTAGLHLCCLSCYSCGYCRNTSGTVQLLCGPGQGQDTPPAAPNTQQRASTSHRHGDAMGTACTALSASTHTYKGWRRHTRVCTLACWPTRRT